MSEFPPRLLAVPVSELLKDPFTVQTRTARFNALCASFAGIFIFNIHAVDVKSVNILGVTFQLSSAEKLPLVIWTIVALFFAEFAVGAVSDVCQRTMHLIDERRGTRRELPGDPDKLAAEVNEERARATGDSLKGVAFGLLLLKVITLDIAAPVTAFWFATSAYHAPQQLGAVPSQERK